MAKSRKWVVGVLLDFKMEKIYDVWKLYDKESQEVVDRISNSGGICAGLSLCWLSLVVNSEIHQSRACPNASLALALQEKVESVELQYEQYPSLVQLRERSFHSFHTLDDALGFLWSNSGSYLIVCTNSQADNGHAISFSGKYVFNPSTGCYKVDSHIAFRHLVLQDGFISDVVKSSKNEQQVYVIEVDKGIRSEYVDEIISDNTSQLFDSESGSDSDSESAPDTDYDTGSEDNNLQNEVDGTIENHRCWCGKCGVHSSDS